MDARDVLTDLALLGVTVAAKGNTLEIRPAALLTDALRQAVRETKPQLLALLADSPHPYRMTPAQADRCHSPCWDDAEIARFVDRVSQFMRQGINASDADDLAERLVLRDRERKGKTAPTVARHGLPSPGGKEVQP
jgi:ABC-type Zn2+ transport system substrate-binding protein/surface adhesin